MPRMLIRVDGEISDDLGSAFPHLTSRIQHSQTTITGDVVDQAELQGVLHLLDVLGITVVDVVTIPD